MAAAKAADTTTEATEAMTAANKEAAAQAEKLAVAVAAAAAKYDPMISDLEKFRDAVQSSITPTQTMYDKFLSTGEITREMSDQIRQLGGNLKDFQAYAGLSKTNKDFADLVQHFRETGDVLPGLRKAFTDFGGDLTALDKAAQLPGLKASLGVFSSLMTGCCRA